MDIRIDTSRHIPKAAKVSLNHKMAKNGHFVNLFGKAEKCFYHFSAFLVILVVCVLAHFFSVFSLTM
jgi:hypothetical protein